jgi:hypothetical protein
LEALLGEGGMGQVFRARATRLGRPVAIKTIRADRAQHPDFQIRFRREAQATAALKHPHMCTLYDVGEQEGVSYLVMEGWVFGFRAPLRRVSRRRRGCSVGSAVGGRRARTGSPR